MTKPQLVRAVIGILMMILPVIYIMTRPELETPMTKKICDKCGKPIDPNSSYDVYGFPGGPKEFLHIECQRLETVVPSWYGNWIGYTDKEDDSE